VTGDEGFPVADAELDPVVVGVVVLEPVDDLDDEPQAATATLARMTNGIRRFTGYLLSVVRGDKASGSIGRTLSRASTGRLTAGHGLSANAGDRREARYPGADDQVNGD
jgi:hypothetical protein